MIIIPDHASIAFKQQIEGVNLDELKSFLESQDKPVYETQIMRVIFGDNAMDCDSLTLYQRHFILFYILYRLQDEYWSSEKFLYVHFMRTKLYDYPPAGKCRFFDENLMLFCNADTDGEFCPYHQSKFADTSALELLSVKYFYYDTDNYDRLDKDTAEAFINGTWEILANYGRLKECFAVMEMSETYDLNEIKRQFRMLAKKYHPDIAGDAGKKFNEINRAYTILKNTIPIINAQ
ncbi:MAG: DnaJ domain-containing protein [Spirochaetales bacterium]|nr:DnaJ domain-containing protein [Spirochaetales bacterium]